MCSLSMYSRVVTVTLLAFLGNAVEWCRSAVGDYQLWWRFRNHEISIYVGHSLAVSFYSLLTRDMSRRHIFIVQFRTGQCACLCNVSFSVLWCLFMEMTFIGCACVWINPFTPFSGHFERDLNAETMAVRIMTFVFSAGFLVWPIVQHVDIRIYAPKQHSKRAKIMSVWW